jgi:hypothetical protein
MTGHLTARRILFARAAVAALLAGTGAAAWLVLRPDRPLDSWAGAGTPDDLTAFVAWGTPVEMEENERVINVTPRVTLDSRGGYLVADGREAQVRRYGEDGTLMQVVGRKGNGPGEFRDLVGVHRLADGRIVVAGMGGRISVFDESGRKLLRTRESGLMPLYESAVLAGPRLLLAGRGGTGGTSLVHVYDVDAGTLERSFMNVPRHDPGQAAAYAFAGSADAAARGDTIAAVFALSDSVYLFDPRGTRLGTIAIPFQRFRRLTRPMPVTGTAEDFRAWSETFSAVSQLHWLPDGSFLVQYYDMKGVEPRWRLLRMTRDGRPRFEGVDTPKLLAAGGDGSLLFVHPAAEAPNVWVTARLRP